MLIFLPMAFLLIFVIIFLVSVFTGRSISEMLDKWMWAVWTVAGLWSVASLVSHLFSFDLYGVAGIHFKTATLLANVVFAGGVLIMFRTFIHKMAINSSGGNGGNPVLALRILGAYATVESLVGMIAFLWIYSSVVNNGELNTPDVNAGQIFSSMIEKAKVDGAIDGTRTQPSTDNSSTPEIVLSGADWKSHIMKQARKKGITSSTKTYNGMKATKSLSSIINDNGNDGWVFCKKNYKSLNERGLLHCATGYVFK